jgi:hypothetical protein
MELAIALTLIVAATSHGSTQRKIFNHSSTPGCETKCIFRAMLYHSTIDPDLERGGVPIIAAPPFTEEFDPVAG